MCPLKNAASSQTFWCNKYRTYACTSAAYNQLHCQHSVFPFAGPVVVTPVSPDSSCLSRRNSAAASRIRLNSMQKACTSRNSSCRWINCMLMNHDMYHLSSVYFCKPWSHLPTFSKHDFFNLIVKKQLKGKWNETNVYTNSAFWINIVISWVVT